MELRIYYYENLLSLKTRPFNEIFILRKFGAIYARYIDITVKQSNRAVIVKPFIETI